MNNIIRTLALIGIGLITIMTVIAVIKSANNNNNTHSLEEIVVYAPSMQQMALADMAMMYMDNCTAGHMHNHSLAYCTCQWVNIQLTTPVDYLITLWEDNNYGNQEHDPLLTISKTNHEVCLDLATSFGN